MEGRERKERRLYMSTQLHLSSCFRGWEKGEGSNFGSYACMVFLQSGGGVGEGERTKTIYMGMCKA